MSFSWFSEEDILLLKEHQSKLEYNSSKRILSGNLHFKAKFSEKEIADKYKIEIDFNQTSPLPLVKEVGGRIQEISQNKNKPLVDLHVNSKIEKGLCLCSRIKAFDYSEKFKASNSPTTDFITDLIIPFFYGLSYFDKFSKYPFGELQHGIPGLIEDMKNDLPAFLKYSDQYQEMHPEEFSKLIDAYIKQDEKLSKKCRAIYQLGRNKKCLCGSGIKYKKCHIDERHLFLVDAIKKHHNLL